MLAQLCLQVNFGRYQVIYILWSVCFRTKVNLQPQAPEHARTSDTGNILYITYHQRIIAIRRLAHLFLDEDLSIYSTLSFSGNFWQH